MTQQPTAAPEVAAAPPANRADRVDGPGGWVAVAATFASTFTVFGVAYSFGAFFGPMADELGSGRSATALFFALTAFGYFSLGVVSGHVADRIGPRPVLLFGAAFLVAGLLATSRVGSIWLGYVTYGIGVGVGVACAYVPMVANVGGWFERRRTTALGVAVAGIGVGTLTVAPLAERLIATHGWRRTYELLAIGAGIVLLVASLGARRPAAARPAPSGPSPGPPAGLVSPGTPLGRLLRPEAGTRLRHDFSILYLSAFLITLSLFVPFVFLPDYLDTEGVSGSAGWLIGAIGISSVVGRLGLGALGSVLAPLRLYQASFLVLGLSFAIWLVAGRSYWLLVAFTVVLGVAYGGFIALAPAVIADLFGTAGLGAMLGALYTASGLGGLVGPPLMGLVIDVSGYPAAQILALACGVAAAALLSGVRGPGGAPPPRDRRSRGDPAPSTTPGRTPERSDPAAGS